MQPHSTAPGVNGKSQPTPEDLPAYVRRDMNMPWYVVYQMILGNVSVVDLLLMHVIGTLIRRQTDDSEALGCFAHNDKLAELSGCHKMHVSKRISHLESMGLVVSVVMRNRRYLELEWSRTAKERSSLRGEYGKLLRDAYRETTKVGGQKNSTSGTPEGKTEGTSKNSTKPKGKAAGKRLDVAPSLYVLESGIENPPTPRRTGSPLARPSREGRGQSASQFFETDGEGQTTRDTSPGSPPARQSPAKEEHQDTDEFFDGYPEGAPVWTVGYSSNYTSAQPDEPEEEETPSAPPEPPVAKPKDKRRRTPGARRATGLDPFAKVDNPAKRLADRLRNVIYRYKEPARKYTQAVWERHMRKLLTTRTEEQISAIITWFGQNIRDKFTPSVFSPSQFVEKYDRLEKAMARATPTEQELADELDRKDGKIPLRRY